MGLPIPEPTSEEAGQGGKRWFPATEAERESVRRQLERILADQAFSNSRRYPKLLKYIVEETLAGRADHLKERNLGVEVFGREPTYDTNQDPVVRTSAAQVRQRMSQYYLEPRHEAELRIELLPGSYVPQFRPASRLEDSPPVGLTVSELAQAAAVENDEAESENGTSPALGVVEFSGSSAQVARRARISARQLLAALAILTIAGLAWTVATRWGRGDAAAAFWKPVWDDPNPIVICVPGRFPTAESVRRVPGDTDRTGPLSIIESLRANSIAWPDATTLYNLVGFVQARGEAYQVRRAGDSALSDLRTGPAILIGGLNNSWLMRLTSRYRFRYENDWATGEAFIVDSQNPNWRDCRVRWLDPYASFEEDYGIVSRVWDPTTERVVVTASGIASYGTIAAGEFLTNPRYLGLIAERASAGWERKNLQVVFTTKVFNGNAGPPQILAIHVW